MLKNHATRTRYAPFFHYTPIGFLQCGKGGVTKFREGIISGFEIVFYACTWKVKGQRARYTRNRLNFNIYSAGGHGVWESTRVLVIVVVHKLKDFRAKSRNPA